MNRPIRSAALGLALTVLSLLGSDPGSAAGFSIFEQGTKAMGMAGAFTAQADDPSAMFHNVGGLAFLAEREFAVGVTWITSAGADFTGLPPGVAAGTTAESESLNEIPPHFYWVEPLNDHWTFGLALNAPFGLVTEWDPERSPGRFISSRAELTVLDLNPNIGLRLSDRFGVGLGLIVRFSTVELDRSLASFDPASGQIVDVARLGIESDMDSGLGYQFGFLGRVNESFSWGFSYRSEIEVDYGGDGRFAQVETGNLGLDALIAATIPFGQDLPIEASVEYPATTSLGVALALNPTWLVEIDANQTDWSSFDIVPITFLTNPEFSSALVPRWDDANHYRVGFKRTNRSGSEWRFGFVMDESPQPDENVGPLLPDADRKGVTVGWGQRGNRFNVDLALMYLPFDDRTTTVNEDDFNGTYESTGLLFGATVGW